MSSRGKGGAGTRKADGGRRVDNRPIMVRVQYGEEKLVVDIPSPNGNVRSLLSHIKTKLPQCQVDGLLTWDGCELEPEDKLTDLVEHGEKIFVASGKTISAKTACVVLASFGLHSCMPRGSFVPAPAFVTQFEDSEMLGPCVVDASAGLKEFYININADMHEDVCAPALGDRGAGLLCRASVGKSALKRIVVDKAKTGGIASVADLLGWARRRCGGLADFVKLYAHVVSLKGEGDEAGDEDNFGDALEESSKLPTLEKGELLLVCTRMMALHLNPSEHPKHEADPRAFVLMADPVRYSDWCGVMEQAAEEHPWLRRMQRCVTSSIGGFMSFNDEVTFANVQHMHPPGPNSAGRLSMRIISHTARRGNKPLYDYPMWSTIPPHGHVLPLFFTAGPHMLFSPYMDTAPVATWLRSGPVQALDQRDMYQIKMSIAIQSARALEHFHAHGVMHRSVNSDNLLVRPSTDMRLPIWMRPHVMLADFGLTSLSILGYSHTRLDKGGVPGFWAPEQVKVLDKDKVPDRWGDSPPLLRWGFERFTEACWSREENKADMDWLAEAVRRQMPKKGDRTPTPEQMLKVLWTESVSAMQRVRQSEKTDVFGWAMTMIHLCAVAAKGRKSHHWWSVKVGTPEAAEEKEGDDEWEDLTKELLGKVMTKCLRKSHDDRPHAAQIVLTLTSGHQKPAVELWCKELSSPERPDGFAPAVDEYMMDLPSLLQVARSRVYVCNALMGLDDEQTKRAEEGVLQVLMATNLQIQPDLCVKALPGATMLDEMLQSAGTVTNWYHLKGPPQIKSFYKEYSTQLESDEKPPGPARQPYGLFHYPYVSVRTDEPAALQQLCYVASLYILAVSVEVYGRKTDALVTLEMLVDYVHKTFGDDHLLAIIPAMHCFRLKTQHSNCSPVEKEILAAQMTAAASILLWEHYNNRRGEEVDSEGKTTVTIGSRMRQPISYPYYYPSAGSVLLAVAHAIVGGPVEMGDEVAAGARRTRGMEMTEIVMKQIEKTSGETSSKLAPCLSFAAKLCRQGVDGSPDLARALMYAQKAVDVLSKAMGFEPSPKRGKMGVGSGGSSARRAVRKHEGYTNIYLGHTPADLANAFVALAEVQRAKGMPSEAGTHFTIAGDILLKHSNESKLMSDSSSRGCKSSLGDDMRPMSKLDSSAESLQSTMNNLVVVDKLQSPMPPASSVSSAARVGGSAALASFTCAAPGCVKTGQFQCSSCKLVRYCSLECQKEDWKRHKLSCKRK